MQAKGETKPGDILPSWIAYLDAAELTSR